MTTAIYTLNRLPSLLLKGCSPFEKLFGHPLYVHHFRVFGSLCYATNPKSLDKFAPRAIPAVHMGYSSSKRGYVLYSLSSKSFFMSRDTVYKELVFPFRDLQFEYAPLFSPLLDIFFADTTCSISLSPQSSSTSFKSSSTSTIPPGDFTYLEFSPPVQPRKSFRISKPPVWLDSLSLLVLNLPACIQYHSIYHILSGPPLTKLLLQAILSLLNLILIWRHVQILNGLRL